jgi:F420-non-reducing hydrogenase iron-sulfur subunit
MATGYEPAIIGFLCNWCSYRAADLIGMTRHHHAPNMRPVRVMCSSRVEPELILRAFRQGADGVMVFGCHPGSCHYVDGNIKAMRRIVLLRRVLDQLGIEPARLGLVWTAA